MMLDRQKQDKEIRDLSDKFVSTILIYAVTTEVHLTSIISFELIKNMKDMVSFIDYFDKSTFERKIDLVEIILKSNHPEIFKEYQNTIAQIKQLKDVRNTIAHYVRTYEYDGQKTMHVLSPTIVRVERNKEGLWVGKGVKKYTVKQMRGLMKMVEQCDSKVREMVEKIRKQNRTLQKH